MNKQIGIKFLFTLVIAIGTIGLAGCEGGNSVELIPNMLSDDPGIEARNIFNVYDADQRRTAINRFANAPWGGDDAYLQTYRMMLGRMPSAPPTAITQPDEDPTVRAAALRALGKHGGPEDGYMVAMYLNLDPDIRTVEPEQVRWEAATALQRLHTEDAIEPLMISLRNDDYVDVRIAAASALAQYATEEVFQTLVGALNDDDFAVVRKSRESLGILTGQEFGEDSADWLAWADQTERLFRYRRAYYYPEFQAPRTGLDKVKFWEKDEPVTPKQPTGVDQEGVGEPTSSEEINELTQALDVSVPASVHVQPTEMAIFVDGKEPVWQDHSFAAGAALPAGLVRLDSGNARVAFGSGATLMAFSNTEFGPHTAHHAYIREGKMLLSVPAEAKGFAVSGPGFTIIDEAGSRFSIVVNRAGVGTIAVYKGRISISYLTRRSGYLMKVPVTADRSIYLNNDGAALPANATLLAFANATPEPVVNIKDERPIGALPDIELRPRTTRPAASPEEAEYRDPTNRQPHPFGATDAP